MGSQYNQKTGARGIEWAERTENAIAGCMHGCRWKTPDGKIIISEVSTLRNIGNLLFREGFERRQNRVRPLAVAFWAGMNAVGKVFR
jgi:hypothetical protein